MSIQDLWINKRGEKTNRHPENGGNPNAGRWLVRWRDPDGFQPSKVFKDNEKRKAINHDAAMRTDVNRGEYFDAARGRTTFKAFGVDWLQHHAVDETSRRAMQSRLGKHVFPVLGSVPLLSLRPSTVRRWLKGMEDSGVSPATRLVVFTHVRSIILAAVEDGRIPAGRSPLRGIKAPTVPDRQVQPWEEKIVGGILDGAAEDQHPLILMIATCGHRQGEALAVGVDQIDFLRREVRIEYQVKRKGGRLVLAPPKRGKVRRVPLPNVTAEALAARLQARKPVEIKAEDGKTVKVLFTDEKGRLIRAQSWNERVWHPLVRAVGMTPGRDTGVHQLRHYYASTLIDNGASMEMVKEYLGHSSIQITSDYYLHLFERSHKRARKAINAAFRKIGKPKSATDVQRGPGGEGVGTSSDA